MKSMKRKLPAFIGTPARNSIMPEVPAMVRYEEYLPDGRRSTKFICECNGAGRDNFADSMLIAELLAKHHGVTFGRVYE